jgi:hypothetical protein
MLLISHHCYITAVRALCVAPSCNSRLQFGAQMSTHQLACAGIVKMVMMLMVMMI